MDIRQDGNFTIVSPTGKLDTISSPEFSRELSDALDKKPYGCIVDLSRVSFLSSSGLQALLAGAKRSRKDGTRYGVCGMSEMVNDVFTLSGFDRFIDTFDDVEGAMESL
jgi:anti-sigma B factor antagonist